MKFILFMLPLVVTLFADAQQVTLPAKVFFDDIKRQAATQEKYIFVDCAANWCGPCNEMDMKVFSDTAVADYLTNQFICMRLQFDLQDTDTNFLSQKKEEIKTLSVKYNITGLPTLLVFNSRGALVLRGSFFRDAAAFLAFLRKSRDEDEQYFFLHEQFNAGVHDRETVNTLLPLAVKRNNERLVKRLKAVEH